MSKLMTVSDVARLCHEANRVFCESTGDGSQVPWEIAPAWQRESAVKGVLFHLNNPTASESASHDEWMREKLINGWKYGEVKDVERKEHPCMMPFADLPLDQQRKDRLFVSVIQSVRDLIEGEWPAAKFTGEKTLRQFQDEHKKWIAYNFPNSAKEPMHSFLGMMEELGEIAHALLKGAQKIRGTAEEHEAAAKDGVGDLLVFTLDFCSKKKWSTQEILEETWNQVKTRDWQKFPKNGRTE